MNANSNWYSLNTRNNIQIAHLFLNFLLLGLLSLFSNAILLGLGLAHDSGLFLHRSLLNFDSLAVLNFPGFAHLKRSKIIKWNCS